MNQIYRLLTRMLPQEDREVVQGDIAEAGEGGWRALHDVCGLVLRRQAAVWTHWRPWLALLGVSVSCGWFLMRQSRTLGRGYAEFFWILRNYADLDPQVLEQTGLTAGDELYKNLVRSVVMICLCWCSGVVLGALSRRAVWFNGALFGVLLLIPAMTVSQGLYPYEVQGVLPLKFYTVIFPVVQQTVTAVMPALWGMRRRFAGL